MFSLSSLTTKVGKRGSIIIPKKLRTRLRLEEGTLVIAEERDGGVFLRAAAPVPIEIYTPERRAEFLLSNAVDAEDYRRAVEEVRKLGVDPNDVPHERPEGA